MFDVVIYQFELCYLLFLSNIARVAKSGRLRWARLIV
jgi:hypothetical protein